MGTATQSMLSDVFQLNNFLQLSTRTGDDDFAPDPRRPSAARTSQWAAQVDGMMMPPGASLTTTPLQETDFTALLEQRFVD